jgi:hypothetical protein
MLWLSVTITAGAFADPASEKVTEVEETRLVQEYLAKRAEWVALRARETEKAKRTKEEKARDQILKKLDADERVLRAAAADLAGRVREAQRRRNEGK